MISEEAVLPGRAFRAQCWITVLTGIAVVAAADLNSVERQLTQHEYGAAKQSLEAVEQESRDTRWHLLMSRAEDGLNEVREAIEEAQRAIESDSRNEAAHLQLAQIFLTRNTPEAAFEILSAAKPSFPESPLVHLGLGLALKEMRRYDEAEGELKTCLTLRADFGTAFDALGSVYLDTGGYDKLLDLASTYSNRNPGDYRGWYYLAAAKQKLGASPDEVVRVIKRCLDLNARFAAGHSLLGKALLDGGDLPGAASALERAIQLRPGYSPAHLYLATAYGRMGRKEDARREAAALARLNEEQSKPAPKLLYRHKPTAPDKPAAPDGPLK